MDEVDSSPIAGILRKYRRDIACFIMAILAVLFCASEWFRVQGAFGQVLHAMASGLFGLTSVILPVFLALVVFSLMRKTQNKDENLHMALGWFMILWSVCSILDAAIASDSQKFDFRSRHPVFVAVDYPYAGHADTGQGEGSGGQVCWNA